jgi:hypothetical protein
MCTRVNSWPFRGVEIRLRQALGGKGRRPWFRGLVYREVVVDCALQISTGQPQRSFRMRRVRTGHRAKLVNEGRIHMRWGGDKTSTAAASTAAGHLVRRDLMRVILFRV